MISFVDKLATSASGGTGDRAVVYPDCEFLTVEVDINLVPLDNDVKLEDLLKENKKLKEEKSCKICIDAEASAYVVFLPSMQNTLCVATSVGSMGSMILVVHFVVGKQKIKSI